MAVQVDKEQRIFTLNTKNSSYQIMADQYGFLLHLYYGAPVRGSMAYRLTHYDRGFAGNPYDAGGDRTYSLDVQPLEYPCQGIGDYRSPALRLRESHGSYSCDLRYEGYEIREEKYGIPGMPAVYAAAGEAQTLELKLRDQKLGLSAVLSYGILPEHDVITRAVRLVNEGKEEIVLDKVQTACLDFLDDGYDLITFYGRHAMERNFQRSPVSHGSTVIGSRRGTSSHQYNPFLIVAEKETAEEAGSCYGLSLLYSGNFKGEAETDQFNQTRVLLGLQDEMFSWRLKPGETFYAPETAMTYSSFGLERLSQNYHRLYRKHLCRGKYRDIRRPVLINNWEATYFDFNREKLLSIAAQAADLGVEMLVLDDGWFGRREDDNSSLGDWQVNERKLGGSLKSLVEEINRLGLKFGIWVEPEMVSEDSELYRTHPDWAFKVPGRKPVRSRNQLVLDFSRPEVVDGVYDQICRVLDSANIEYVKWDMNRSITDVYSCLKDRESQGEVLHRYVLGLYDFQERLLKRYPDLLLEGCSGGGGRFDAGMLYYSPQIWCSDNTDAIDRVFIQYGTSFGYPVSASGSHVSAVPNHQTGRVTPMKTRGVTAMAGSFGYELDLNRISEEEKNCVREQMKSFKRYWKVIHQGDYYRLTNPFEKELGAWQFVSQDKKEALVNLVMLQSHGNQPVSYVRLRGLKEEALYEDQETKEVHYGSDLMNGGIPVPWNLGEYQAYQMYLVEKGESDEIKK